MTPSGLVPAVTFLIIAPTALVVRLLTLLNLNAVVLYYPYILSLHENRPLASFDNNTTLGKDDFLSLWLSHILQNHNLSQSMPQWEGQGEPIAVSVHLTIEFARPPVNDSFDPVVAVNMAEPILQNGIPQSI